MPRPDGRGFFISIDGASGLAYNTSMRPDADEWDSEEDDGWLSDSMRNENRYKEILDRSHIGSLALVIQALKEDPALLLPRILFLSFGTAWKIPRARLCRGRASREAYARRVLAAWSHALSRAA
jgi:hypothetical protein